MSVIRTDNGAAVMTPTVGNKPFGVAFDGTYIWVVNQYDDSVDVLNKVSGGIVVSTTVGHLPQGIVFDGSSMWVPNNGGTTVSKLTLGEKPPATNTATATITPTITKTPTATDTSAPTNTPTATKTGTPWLGAFLPLLLRQPTPTPCATPSQTAVPSETPTPKVSSTPGPHLVDGYYRTNLADKEISFWVQYGGTQGIDGYFMYPSACNSAAWFFAGPVAISGGQFGFADDFNRYGIPAVWLSCSSTTSTTASCTAHSDYAFRYCGPIDGIAVWQGY
jgi:hypothetical protein